MLKTEDRSQRPPTECKENLTIGYHHQCIDPAEAEANTQKTCQSAFELTMHMQTNLFFNTIK